MPNQTKNINKFTKGTICNPDIEDISDEAASDSLNLDANNEDGKLKGVPISGTAKVITSGDGADIRLGEFIENGTQFDLVYHDSNENKIKAITDFYGTLTASDLVASNVSDNTVIVPNNREVHIGTGYGSANVPKWVGLIGYGQFGGAVPSGLQAENAGITASSLGINLAVGITKYEHSTVATDAFQAGEIFAVAFSFVYDNYQETPLTYSTPGVLSRSGFSITSGNSSETIDYSIKIANFATMSKRINAVKVYRARATARTSIPPLYDAIEPFHLVDTIDITGSGWTTDGTSKIKTYSDTGTLGNSYEQETGIPDTLETTIMNYSLACKGNGFFFTSKGYLADIPDAIQCVFRSKEKRFDMFNWTTDILRLPRIPTAMVFYLGRVFAFDVNHVYIINAEGLYIEDEFPGIGAIGQRSVWVTSQGLFCANEIGAWMFDGSWQEISNRIKESSVSGRSWQTFSFDSLSEIIIAYEGRRGQVLFINQSSSNSFAWTYHIQKDRWDALSLGSIALTANSGIISGKNGETFLSNAVQMVELFAGATRENWEFISKDFTTEEPSQDRKHYFLKTQEEGTGTLTKYYGIENVSPATVITSDEIKSGGAWFKANSIRFKLTGTGTKEVNSMSLIYRDMVGVRNYA